MIGFQCSATISQPCIGRTLFPSAPTHQPSNGFHTRPAIPSSNLVEYFPVNGDGLRLSWAHAANTRSKLTQALRGDELMIEADVSLAETTRYPVPIMAHPPLNMSDMTLEDWLVEVVRSNSGKGIKLDFKTTRVVEPAFRVLARHVDYIKGPIILNADILPGPNKPTTSPVDIWTFLILCKTRFPKAIISIGWTTLVDEMSVKTGYTRDMVDHMASLVKEYNLSQPLTFAVNASLLKYSICELQRLLFQVPNSTLTVWAHPHEFESNLTLHDLMLIRKSFSMSSVFYDMPSDILNQLRVEIYNN
ncbi:unnamed protein product [Medioppia subpectinata]|uniref:Menorin-like domain-containing protein n=1 Tax=Medioppia subpectinata TaxID=1979941 RepID=A0A7R9KRD1_9ACAR|nr:unnamed protein product [Medioppia subpectinata]CAG2107036.1 unnamed protein product [Medioppia subpectinata]